jgi:hypothetical protein
VHRTIYDGSLDDFGVGGTVSAAYVSVVGVVGRRTRRTESETSETETDRWDA